MMKINNPYSITSNTLFLMSALMFFISLFFISTNQTMIIVWEITTIYNSFLYFPIILDQKGLIFSTIVLFISANVISFAKTYMENEMFNYRFTILVLLFILSMNMLIFFPHLMTLLLGWDGLGLTSFILVIYYQNSKSLGAGMITALTNRIGDALLIIAIAWSLNINHWLILHLWNSSLDKFIILSITIAAMTKSAQMPFSSWLPAAMAAPTPVSALVHSSTLVTAGVFLMVRFYNFLASFYMFNSIILFVSCLTMLMAGLSALTECDLKKVIALSTLSQLGVMMASLGLGAPDLAFFHLITHALFKALLFICAGLIIHFHAHSQDMRNIGNLTPQLPITMSAMLIANMSLCGLPFLSGFYSKDLILETSLFSPTNWLIFFMLMLATMLTMSYSFRLMFNSVWGPNLSHPYHNINDFDINIKKPVTFLTIGAIMAGTLINWELTPMSQEIYLPLTQKIMPLFITLLAAFSTFLLTPMLSSNKSTLTHNQMNHNASCSMWFLTPLSTQSLMPSFFKLSHNMQKSLDQGWMEFYSAQGMFKSSSYLSKTFQSTQASYTMTSMLMMLISLLFGLMLVTTL